jgi:chloramphenicol-sensitive protein RarD
LVTLGLLQYLTPTLQFLLGVVYFHEDMPAGRWVGFGLVWVALVILTVESLRHRHTSGRLSAAATTTSDASLAPFIE